MTSEQPEPLGLGNCGRCAYREAGSARTCFTCAHRTMAPLPESRCPTCDQHIPAGGGCSNDVCRMSEDERGFIWNYAIAMRTAELKHGINRLKYENAWGWAPIFGRVLVGFLDSEVSTFGPFDMIIPSPTFLSDEHPTDHTGAILKAATLEPSQWPFAPPGIIVKTHATPRMVGLNKAERRHVAERELREALLVPQPDAVRGKIILVFDDVYTNGFTLREVALCLRAAGADVVCGVSLSRQPWG